MVASKKYVPKPEGLHLEFHERCASTGVLHLQRCLSCGEHRHTPRRYCPSCHSKEYEFAPVTGTGLVYSLVVNHFTVDPGWVDEVPYTLAVVELDEGPRIVGSLRSDDPHAVSVGDQVLVTVEPRGADVAYLWVEPSGNG